MPSELFLGPRQTKAWLAERGATLGFLAGGNVTRLNNEVREFATETPALGVGESLHGPTKPISDEDGNVTGWRGMVVFEETIPKVGKSGIVEMEIQRRAFGHFALFIIVSNQARLDAAHNALQSHKLYYGALTSILYSDALRDELADDIAAWSQARKDATGVSPLTAALDAAEASTRNATTTGAIWSAVRFMMGVSLKDVNKFRRGRDE